MAGGIIHIALLAFLLLVPLGCLLLAPPRPSAQAVAALAVRLSLWFVAGLIGVALVALPAAAIVDRLVRRQRRRRVEPPSAAEAVASRGRVRAAAAKPLDDAAAPVVARIAAAGWNHDEQRYQALSRDFEEVVGTATVALASAAPDRRAALAAIVAQALTRIADELDMLAAARAQADEDRVRILSNYLDARYPAPDSPLRPD